MAKNNEYYILQKNKELIPNFSNESAENLINEKSAWFIFKLQDKFPDFHLTEDHAIKIVQNNEGQLVSKYIERFPNFSNKTAELFINKAIGGGVMMHLEKFPNFKPTELHAQKIARNESASTLDAIIDKFPELSNETANILIEKNSSYVVLKNRKMFPYFVANAEVAKKMSENGELDSIARYIKEFTEIPTNVGIELVTKGFRKEINENTRAFPEKFKEILPFVDSILESPSQEIRRMTHELVSELSQVSDPKDAWQKIESVFLKNNLPEMGKRLRVFEILYPASRLDKILETSFLSPTLRVQKSADRPRVIYRDILQVSLDSNNPSLRKYLEVFSESGTLLQKVEKQGVNALNQEEQKRFDKFVQKLQALFTQTRDGQRVDLLTTETSSSFEILRKMRESLNVQEGQTTGERLAEMHLKPIGLKTIEEALNRMNQASRDADKKGRELAEQIRNDAFQIHEGDLLKGVDQKAVPRILESGGLAREFMGATAESDATPLDTDLIAIPKDKADFQRLRETIEDDSLVVKRYGEVTIFMKKDERFIRTDLGEKEDVLKKENQNTKKYELFKTGVLSAESHMGIRTGFASTEIDALIVSDKIAKNVKQTQSLFADIATGGRYIPILDRDGKLLLTPEVYDKTREQSFSALSRQDSAAYKLNHESTKNLKLAEDIENIKVESREDREKAQKISQFITSLIREEFTKLGLTMHDAHNDSLLEVKLEETGSSSRGTNMPGSYDFDYMARLNSKDITKTDILHDNLLERFISLGAKKHDADRSEQLRVLEVKIPGIEGAVDVDIGFVKKSELEVYESHDAVSERLANIKEKLGNEAFETVTANIVLTKKILKAEKIYKKGEHGDGGLGGIGVENWILANGGDVITAFKTFEEASKNPDGSQRSFEEFKQNYLIIDPGINAKFGTHDNFVFNMTEKGYNKMCKTVADYLKEHN